MNIYTEDKCVVIDGISDFDVTHTFDCGQCFRWEREEDGSYTGVAFGKVVNIASKDNRVVISNSCVEDVENIWIDYLDLKEDYGSVKSGFSADENLSKAMDFGFGIRILRQEMFECLISFIISTQNAIPRIKKIVSKLCEMYGTPIEYRGKTYYAFPEPEQLADITEEDLAPLRAGYRAKYIVDCVNKVLTGQINLNDVFNRETSSARKELLKISGVGPKVADCVMLFSMKKYDAFPIDVWVKRIMSTLYLDENATTNDIQAYAAEKFGKYAGVAQQYLFYYARENG